MQKKIISIMLTLVMLVSLLPAGLTVSAATLAESMIFQLEFNGDDSTDIVYRWVYDNDKNYPLTVTPVDGTVTLNRETFKNGEGTARQPVLKFNEVISLSGKTDTVLEARMKIDMASSSTATTVSAGKQILSLVESGNYHASAWGVSGKLAYGGGQQNNASNANIITDYALNIGTWYTYYLHLNTAGKLVKVDIIGDDGTAYFADTWTGMPYGGTVTSVDHILFPFSETHTTTLDYLRLYDASALAEPTVTYEADGAATALSGALSVPTAFDATITFGEEITEADLASIIVNNSANVTKTLSEDGLTVTLAFSELEAGTAYKINAPRIGSNSDISVAFATAAVIPEWYIAKFDFDGTEDLSSWGTYGSNTFTAAASLNVSGGLLTYTGGGNYHLMYQNDLSEKTSGATEIIWETRMKLEATNSSYKIAETDDDGNETGKYLFASPQYLIGNTNTNLFTKSGYFGYNGESSQLASAKVSTYKIYDGEWYTYRITMNYSANRYSAYICDDYGNEFTVSNQYMSAGSQNWGLYYLGYAKSQIDYMYIMDGTKFPQPSASYDVDGAATELNGALGVPKTFNATLTYAQAITETDLAKITVSNNVNAVKTLSEDGLTVTLAFEELAARTAYTITSGAIGIHKEKEITFTTANEDWYLYQAEFDGNDGYIGTKSTGDIADGVITMTPANANTYLRFDLSDNPIDLTGGGNYVMETRVKYNQYESDDTNDTVTPNSNLNGSKRIFSLVLGESSSCANLWAVSGNLRTGALGNVPSSDNTNGATVVENTWYTIRYTNFANRNTYHVNIKDDDGNVIYDGDAASGGTVLSSIKRIDYSYRANMGATVDYMRIWDEDLIPATDAFIDGVALEDVRRAKEGDIVTLTFPWAAAAADLEGKVTLGGAAITPVLAADGMSATFALPEMEPRTFYTLNVAEMAGFKAAEITFRSADEGRYYYNAQFDGNDDDSAFIIQGTDRSVTPSVTTYTPFTNSHSWISDGVLWNNSSDKYFRLDFADNDDVYSGMTGYEEVVLETKFKLEPGTSGSTMRREFFRFGNIGLITAHDSDADGLKELHYDSGGSSSSNGTSFKLYEDDYELENGEWYIMSVTLNYVAQTYKVSLEKAGSGNPVSSGAIGMNSRLSSDTKTGIPYITAAYYAGASYSKISFDYITIENMEYGKADVTFNGGAKLEHTSVMPITGNTITVELMDDATTTDGITLCDLAGNSVAFNAQMSGNIITIVPDALSYDTTYQLYLPVSVTGGTVEQTVEFATIYNETATFAYPAGFEADAFSADNKLDVVYFGGSITANAGWRDYSTEWFQEKYGADNVNAVNASYGGTGTAYGWIRLGRDVVSSNPDIVFVEFTTNDATNQTRGQTMESIVRSLNTLDKPPVIIFVHTMRQDLVRNTAAVDEFNQIARNYGIPVINIRDYVLGKYRTDADFAADWDTLGVYISNDATHPASGGSQLYGSYVNGVLEANAAKYFVHPNKAAPAIKGGSDIILNYANIDDEALSAAGNTYTTTVTGNEFKFDVIRSTSGGKFSVTVDGIVKLESVDAYNTSSTPMPLYTISGLGAGTHEVVFTVLEDVNASSTGNNVNIKTIFTYPQSPVTFTAVEFDADTVAAGTALTASTTYVANAASPYCLIIALYDENGVLSGMQITESTTDASGVEREVTATVTPKTGEVKARAFIWNSLNDMIPYAQSAVTQ